MEIMAHLQIDDNRRIIIIVVEDAPTIGIAKVVAVGVGIATAGAAPGA